ncbi:MAG: hypothetical protein V3T01_07980 [Myxococcota bacterium]
MKRAGNDTEGLRSANLEGMGGMGVPMSWRGAQWSGAIALAVLPMLFLVLRCSFSPEISFIHQTSEAPWLIAPRPVDATLRQWGKAEVPVDTFKGRIDLPDLSDSMDSTAATGPVYANLRAMRRFKLWVNGNALSPVMSDASAWRTETRVDLSPWLHPGRNEIWVEVENPSGPPLLSLRFEGLPAPLAAGPSWWVESRGRTVGFARIADDTFRNPRTVAVATPAREFRERSDSVLLLFMLGLLGFLAGRHFLGPRPRAALPAAVLILGSAAWVGLFVAKLARLPLTIGFDARHHLAYVSFLRDNGALPFASDGWSMYHPPLFYVLSAGLASLGDWMTGGAAPSLALKILPFLSGLGGVWIAFALARKLFPEDPRVCVFSTLFAAALPMNLYGSAYFSNEMPHAFLLGLALFATVTALLETRTGALRAAMIGISFGLASLTKFTALAVAPIAFLFLWVKLTAVERAPAARAIGIVALAAATLLCVSGWFYLRNWVELGQPLVGNWSVTTPGQTWWQQPGFHTLSYFTGFGESLIHPYQAGFHSFWDGIYSTLWGDGGIAGRVQPERPHRFWNYGFMSMAYWIALPATALVLFGAGRCVQLGFRGDPGRRVALCFLATSAYAVGWAILYMSVQLPFHAQAKAFYGLSMGAPLSLFFALAAVRVDTLLLGVPAPVRAAFYGYLFLFASVMFLSYAA